MDINFHEVQIFVDLWDFYPQKWLNVISVIRPHKLTHKIVLTSQPQKFKPTKLTTLTAVSLQGCFTVPLWILCCIWYLWTSDHRIDVEPQMKHGFTMVYQCIQHYSCVHIPYPVWQEHIVTHKYKMLTLTGTHCNTLRQNADSDKYIHSVDTVSWRWKCFEFPYNQIRKRLFTMPQD